MRESPTQLVSEALTLLERALSGLRINTRYNKSDKRKAVHKRYDHSEKGKARQRRYNHSSLHIAAVKRYNDTPHGRIINAMNNRRPERMLSKRLHKQEQRLGKRPNIF